MKIFKGYGHLESDRSPAPVETKLLGRAFSQKKRFCAPLLGGGEEEKPSLPPKGHLVVYVGGGEEMGPPQRYFVPVLYCNHPLFGELLREAEEEFGFQHPAGITIPCPTSRFEWVSSRIAGAIDRRSSGRRSFKAF
ncbi:hypothetical protein KFK09_008065 [Dendrobium nobile]|uniref:Uncharacterized protein n=1 Tax=Dendrobium nobile TaxID=94219 RepID=A0A8T3BW22_DENNO|nr:hypothetical protein KFK09_008065 [Dendrobium nobile]